jgi:hypothetical protein
VLHEFCDGDAVRVGQFRVEQHHVRPEVIDQSQRLLAGARVPHVPELRLAPQGHAEQLREGLVAVDDEHGDHRVTHFATSLTEQSSKSMFPYRESPPY